MISSLLFNKQLRTGAQFSSIHYYRIDQDLLYLSSFIYKQLRTGAHFSFPPLLSLSLWALFPLSLFPSLSLPLLVLSLSSLSLWASLTSPLILALALPFPFNLSSKFPVGLGSLARSSLPLALAWWRPFPFFLPCRAGLLWRWLGSRLVSPRPPSFFG